MTESMFSLIQSLDEQLTQCNSSMDASCVLGRYWQAHWRWISDKDAKKCVKWLKEVLKLERGC